MRKFCVPRMPYVLFICAAARVHSCSQTSAFSITFEYVIILCSSLAYAHVREGSVWTVKPALMAKNSGDEPGEIPAKNPFTFKNISIFF
mmetsp:Transcript_36219/g.90409  ORF Transcript_36219/g.90409 Transcript_36219/m.90409 type:complete len:89 (-) Transcript_36219:14-280(-)